MSPLVVIAGLAILVVAYCVWAWIRSRGSLYRKLFAEAHLLEVAEKIGALKQTALSNIGIENTQKIQSPNDDPRWFRTQAGLALFYTINNDSPGKYVHYASVSVSGTYTAHAVGETFILLWARLLGVGYERLALGVSRTTVHHAQFVLEEAEQMDFAGRSVEPLTGEGLRALLNERSTVREKLAWGQV
jgi:hypothetical protein